MNCLEYDYTPVTSFGKSKLKLNCKLNQNLVGSTYGRFYIKFPQNRMKVHIFHVNLIYVIYWYSFRNEDNEILVNKTPWPFNYLSILVW
jgi:hypothetical protein